jgi:hypothetical protein
MLVRSRQRRRLTGSTGSVGPSNWHTPLSQLVALTPNAAPVSPSMSWNTPDQPMLDRLPSVVWNVNPTGSGSGRCVLAQPEAAHAARRPRNHAERFVLKIA